MERRNIQSKKKKIMQLVMVYTPWITVICVEFAFIGLATADWDRWWSDARYRNNR